MNDQSEKAISPEAWAIINECTYHIRTVQTQLRLAQKERQQQTSDLLMQQSENYRQWQASLHELELELKRQLIIALNKADKPSEID